jgi:hypothetical protein
MKFLVSSLGMERPGIMEWFPLYSDPASFGLTLLFCIPLIGGLFVARKINDLFGLAALLFSGYCAFRHTRFLPFFMITAAIFGAPYVAVCLERIRALRPHLMTAATRCGALVCGGFIAVGALHLLVLVFSPSTYRMNYSNFPIGAIEWLRGRQTTGRLLVDFNVGSYAMWRLYPNMKISTDGRYEECYPETTVRDNALAFRPDLEVGRAALERIDPTHIVLPSNHKIVDPESSFGDGWRVVYRDPQAVVLAHGVNGDATSTTEMAVVPRDMWEARF